MKLYTFTHFMLSPMAKGIQALHSTVEMTVKYHKYFENETIHIMTFGKHNQIEKNKSDMFYDWAKNHKTCISLNGGVSTNLNGLRDFLNNEDNIYPWAEFYEDESLGNLMTSISLVLPEKIYLMKDYLRQYKSLKFSDEGEVIYLNIPEFDEINEEDLEKIASFGNYSLYEIVLINEISKYKLAN